MNILYQNKQFNRNSFLNDKFSIFNMLSRIGLFCVVHVILDTILAIENEYYKRIGYSKSLILQGALLFYAYGLIAYQYSLTIHCLIFSILNSILSCILGFYS